MESEIFLATYGILVVIVIVLFFDWLRLRRSEARLKSLAFIDEMTGIGNRRTFNGVMRSAMAHALRSGEPLMVVLIDVNDFKAPNDRYGHPFGDKMLCRIAECLKGAIRPTDTACRIGGDEFALVLVDCDALGAMSVVDRIILHLKESTLTHGQDRIPLRVSFGGTMLSTVGGRVSVAGNDLGQSVDPNVLERICVRLYDEADTRLSDAKTLKAAVAYPVVIS